jgi:hypothetical protein
MHSLATLEFPYILLVHLTYFQLNKTPLSLNSQCIVFPDAIRKSYFLIPLSKIIILLTIGYPKFPGYNIIILYYLLYII